VSYAKSGGQPGSLAELVSRMVYAVFRQSATPAKGGYYNSPLGGTPFLRQIGELKDTVSALAERSRTPVQNWLGKEKRHVPALAAVARQNS